MMGIEFWIVMVILAIFLIWRKEKTEDDDGPCDWENYDSFKKELKKAMKS